MLKVEPIFQYKAEDAATPSQPATKEVEEEEEKKEKEKGKVVEVFDSEDEFEDDFEVFNQPESPKVLVGDFSPSKPNTRRSFHPKSHGDTM